MISLIFFGRHNKLTATRSTATRRRSAASLGSPETRPGTMPAGVGSSAARQWNALAERPTEVTFVLVGYGDHECASDPREVDSADMQRAVLNLGLELGVLPGWGSGWTLVALHAQRWSWSMPLASRGAAPTARCRVAQAVAVRVLGEHGVAVEGWVSGGGSELPVFRALLSSR